MNDSNHQKIIVAHSLAVPEEADADLAAEIARLQPDLIILDQQQDAVLKQAGEATVAESRPITCFSAAKDRNKIQAAMEADVSAWVLAGLSLLIKSCAMPCPTLVVRHTPIFSFCRRFAMVKNRRWSRTVNCPKSRSACWMCQICLSDRPVLMQCTALVRDLQKMPPPTRPQGWHTTCRERGSANSGIPMQNLSH